MIVYASDGLFSQSGRRSQASGRSVAAERSKLGRGAPPGIRATQYRVRWGPDQR